MTIQEYKVIHNTEGKLERVLVAEYNAELHDNKLYCDGKYLPIEYKTDWSIRILKTKIQTYYKPEQFFKTFFVDHFWHDYARQCCKQIKQYGREA